MFNLKIFQLIDVEMFTFAGRSVCMANGCVNLKAAATDISQYSNDEEGVHLELQKLM